MSAFDPTTVREAIAAFTPRRPPRFHELSAAREVIVELRQKRASYRAIAELLTQHCLPVSKTAVAAFCHEILGEIVRPRRRPNRKRGSGKESAIRGESGDALPARESSVANESASTAAATAVTDSPETTGQRSRGPRIAKVRLIQPSPK